MALSKRRVLEKLLRLMSRAVLKKYRPLIIGITGSVGKSSAKEALLVMLSPVYSVRGAAGNYNNEIGIPLTIIGAQSGGASLPGWFFVFLKWLWVMLIPGRYPEILILEMGIGRPGDMSYLLEFIPVKIGIATHVSSSHLLYFGSITNIAKEKSKLISALPEDGYAILNADDKRTLKMREKTGAKVVTYGFSAEADVRADHILFQRDPDRLEGFSFKVITAGKTVPIRLPKIVAEHHILAALSAIAVGVVLKMNLVDIAASLENFEPLPGRLHLLAGRDHTLLIDDTYNASPASTRAALRVMQTLIAPRKIVILGDMLELGAEAVTEHERLAEAVEAVGASLVVTVGKHMRALHEALQADGFSRRELMWFPDPLTVASVILNLIRPKDLILLKGSQSMRLEMITAELLARPEDAWRLLCRQSADWRKKPFAPPAEWTETE